MKKNYFLKAKLFIFFLSYLGLMSAANANPAQKKIKKISEDLAKYCFVQSAEKAKIEVDEKEKDTFIVTLEHVGPRVTYFSERPQRKVGSMAIKEFITLWQRRDKDSFRDDPPNADLNGVLEKDGRVCDFIVELMDPHFIENEILTYKAKVLKSQKGCSSMKPMTLQHITLFIDDVCIECWG